MKQSFVSVNCAKAEKWEEGFTLLELQIATAILSILVMISLPYYQDYRTRSKISAELGLLEPVKRLVSEQFFLAGHWPTSNIDASAKVATDYHGEYLQSVKVGDQPKPGSITLTFDKTALQALGDKNTIIFYPQDVLNRNSLSWLCDKGSMENVYRPHNCRR